MIWYRHWLELRVPTLVVMAGAALSAWRYASALASGVPSVISDTQGSVFRTFAELVPVVGAQQVLVWGAHATYAFTLAALVPLVLAGSGLGDGLFMVQPTWRGFARSAFTTSLPVSRMHVLWTRLVAAGVASSAVFFVYLLAHIGVLVATGRDVPFVPMAVASLAAAILSVAGIAVVGLVLMLSPLLFPLLLVPTVAALPLGRPAMHLAGYGAISVGWIVLVAAIAGAALLLSAQFAQIGDE